MPQMGINTSADVPEFFNLTCMEIIFIYSKEGKIKVLNFETSKTLHNEVIENGWSYAHTLNPCIFLEYLFEKTDSEIVNEIRSLNTP